MRQAKKKEEKPADKERRETWQAAQEFADFLGQTHPLFQSAVRTLMSMKPESVDRFTLHETYPLNTLSKSGIFQSVIYHAGMSIHEIELAMIEKLTMKSLLAVFPPDELACLIAALYLYRQCRKTVDAEVWETMHREIQLQMEAGYHVGSFIPSIGTPKGLLVGAIRYTALSLFSMESMRTYRLFKRRLDENEVLFDIEREKELWGCNHLQVAALILQQSGFGLTAARGLCPELVSDENGNEALSEESKAWYATRRWIEAVLVEEKAPAEYSGGSFSVPSDKFSELGKKIEAIFENGSSFNWIDQGAADLPAEVAQQLAAGPQSKAGKAPAEPPAEQIDPEEILKNL